MFECNLHPSNIKTWPSIDSSQMTPTRLVSESLKLILMSNQQKYTNIWIACYSRAFMLDEFKVYLYAIILSSHQKVSIIYRAFT